MTPTPSFPLLLALLGFASCALAGETNLNKGLIAHYPFDGDANDASGNGHNGKLSGVTLVKDRLGVPGKAYKFDGEDDYVRIPFDPAFNAPSVTLAAWVKLTRSFRGNGQNAILLKSCHSHSPPYYQWGLSVAGDLFPHSDEVFHLGIHGGAGQAAGIGAHEKNVPTPLLGRWAHMAGVIHSEAGKITFYLDGRKQKKSFRGSIEMETFETDLFIGRHRNLHRELDFTPCVLDEVRIYNRTLSSKRIRKLYESERPAKPDLPSATKRSPESDPFAGEK